MYHGAGHYEIMRYLLCSCSIEWYDVDSITLLLRPQPSQLSDIE